MGKNRHTDALCSDSKQPTAKGLIIIGANQGMPDLYIPASSRVPMN